HRFIMLISHFILNAAELAEEKGYRINDDEIRMELVQNLHTGYKRFSQNSTSITAQQIQQYFKRTMDQWGVDEKMLLNCWRKIMLFRRLLADVGGSVLLDSLAYKNFHDYSKQTALIDLYE